jgi:hypothetical protein
MSKELKIILFFEALTLLIVCSSSAMSLTPDVRVKISPVRNLRAKARNIFTSISFHELRITYLFIWATAH